MPFKFLSGTQTLYQKGINIEITFGAKSGAGKRGGGWNYCESYWALSRSQSEATH